MLTSFHYKEQSFGKRLLPCIAVYFYAIPTAQYAYMPILEIHLFGGLQITLDDTPVHGFISTKAPALLAYLACEQRPCLRDELAALLWGEMPEADAKNNLRQVLSNLRRLLGNHLSITRRDATLNSNASFFLDVANFEAYLPKCADPVIWERAVALYRGDFMAGIFVRDAPRFEEWMLARRARYRELALYTWHNLTEYYLHHYKYGRAIDSASHLLEIDIWREEAHRQLMRALFYSGQRAAAVRQYEICRRALATGLDTSPSGETTLLYERILATRDRPRHNLPVPSAPFIGREAELARIEAWLTAKESRLLTITGLGGVGKTRLALQAARAHTADFLEGVWFVSLASASAGSLLVPIMAGVISYQFSESDSPTEQLLGYLRGRELLLVLDNMEHLLSPRNLAFLAELTTHAPGVKLLGTSRERLHLRAETVLKLEGLPYVAESRSTAEQFFVECARRVYPTFDPAGQKAALAHLCRLTEGLPLALELAAIWTRVLDTAGIVAEIERSLDFLATDWPDLPPRQRSLQAVFDYSWQMLIEEEQAIYARLSVFRGGFTAEAAREVTGTSLSLLAKLIDKSLLYLDDNGRYRRHPLLRQFAAAKLAESATEQKVTRQKHAHFYGHFVQQLEPLLFGSRVEVALTRIRPELDNARLAWKTAVAGQNTTVINEMADTFMWFFDLLGLYQEGLGLAEEAIAVLASCSTSIDERLALGRSYKLAAVCAFRLGKSKLAETHIQAALKLLAPFQPHVAYGHSLLGAGAIAYNQGSVKKANKFWRQAVDVYRTVGSSWGECAAQSNLAEAALALEDLTATRHYASVACNLARRIGNIELVATTLQILAEMARREGNFAQALEWEQEAVALHRQVGHKAYEANALAGLSRIATDQGNYQQAMNWLMEYARILRQLGREVDLNRQLEMLAQMAQKADE